MEKSKQFSVISPLHKLENELTLKLLLSEDLAALFSTINENKEHLKKWMPWLTEDYAIKDTQNFLSYCIKKYKAQEALIYGIWYKDDLVGVCGSHDIIWQHESTSLGYWLAKKAEGKGIMTKVVTFMLTYLFCNLNLNRIVIQAAEDNIKSRAIPERLGFIFEGIHRQAEKIHGRFSDSATYSILREEWLVKN